MSPNSKPPIHLSIQSFVGQDLLNENLASQLARELQQNLSQEIETEFSAANRQPRGYFFVDPDQKPEKLIGGLQGYVHWNWFYISHLWVHQNHRKKGLAQELLKRAIADAKSAKLIGVYVDTFDPRTVALYERAGFKQIGQIDEFPRGHRRTFLSLKL